jgi:hypothetical protein
VTSPLFSPRCPVALPGIPPWRRKAPQQYQKNCFACTTCWRFP